MLVALVLLLVPAAPASADDYRAERFDARIEVLQGGHLRVTETIVFRFEDGTFTKVFRVIPTRRTDGVDFISASMDGVDFPVGTGPGRVSVRRKDGLRVEWLFPTKQGTSHTFVLTYLARAVARPDAHHDSAYVIEWRALPNEHKYKIDASTVDIVLPADAIGAPVVQVRRVETWHMTTRYHAFTISARDIGRNGWIEFSVPMGGGWLPTEPPEWQQRRARFDSYRNPALVAAGVVLAAAIIVLFGIRQSYDAPPPEGSAPTTFSGPPDPLPPGLAGALASNGTPKAEHAFAALFALAQRGVIAVREEPATWGVRSFALTRNAGPGPLALHEQAVLDTVFRGTTSTGESVTMRKAHSHLSMKFSRFRDAVVTELAEAGLLDSGRQQVRRHFNVAGVGLLVLGALAIVPVALTLQRYGPWLFLVPGALFVAAVVSFITGAAHTPLSNEGVRRAGAWRAYRKFLRNMPAESPRHQSMHSPATLLPYAVALGLGMLWSKLFKSRSAELPPWFHAVSAVDAHRAFVAFVGTGGAAAGHGGGAGGGGAAGGGASGAG